MKLMWKESILIGIIVFGAGFVIGWHPTLESVRNFVITGFSLGLVVNLFWLFAEIFKEHKEKKRLNRYVLSEIELNQNRLKLFADSATNVSYDDDLIGEELFPNELCFDNTINSDLSDKLRLLDNKCLKGVIKYYSELKHIEEEYKRVHLIHGMSNSFLAVLELKDKSGKWNYGSLAWSEIVKYLRHTKEVYDLGQELIIGLKDETGIKQKKKKLKEPTMEHLRTKSPNIRKLLSECEELRTQISKDRKRIIKYVETEYGGLPPDFEWEAHPDEKKRPIYEMFEEYYQKAKILENGKIKDSKKFVETLVNDKTFSEMFETLRKNEADLYQKTIEIERCLSKIEPDFEKRHSVLKGWYDEPEKR